MSLLISGSHVDGFKDTFPVSFQVILARNGYKDRFITGKLNKHLIQSENY